MVRDASRSTFRPGLVRRHGTTEEAASSQSKLIKNRYSATRSVGHHATRHLSYPATSAVGFAGNDIDKATGATIGLGHR